MNRLIGDTGIAGGGFYPNLPQHRHLIFFNLCFLPRLLSRIVLSREIIAAFMDLMDMCILEYPETFSQSPHTIYDSPTR